MHKFSIAFLSVLFLSSFSWAVSLPLEDQLSEIFLDQKDQLLYQTQVIPKGASSSLCGPTSAVNWLQLKSSDGYSKMDLVTMIDVIGTGLRKNNSVEINNGLTEIQLIQFLDTLSYRLGRSTRYTLISRSLLAASDLWSPNTQILALNYSEPIRRGPGPIRRDDYMNTRAPIQGKHFVLKVFADEANSELWLLDPENPTTYTKVKLEANTTSSGSEFRIRPLTRDGLSSFAFGVPLIWTVTGAIEEVN